MQQEVKEVWLKVRTLTQTLHAARTQVESAGKACYYLHPQYEAGTSGSVDVLSALNDLNVSQRDVATQTYDYRSRCVTSRKQPVSFRMSE